MNGAGSIVKSPIISFKGIPANEPDTDFIFALQDKIKSVCKTYSLKNSNQKENLIEELRSKCRKIIKEKTGKRPFTNINLVRI